MLVLKVGNDYLCGWLNAKEPEKLRERIKAMVEEVAENPEEVARKLADSISKPDEITTALMETFGWRTFRYPANSRYEDVVIFAIHDENLLERLRLCREEVSVLLNLYRWSIIKRYLDRLKRFLFFYEISEEEIDGAIAKAVRELSFKPLYEVAEGRKMSSLVYPPVEAAEVIRMFELCPDFQSVPRGEK